MRDVHILDLISPDFDDIVFDIDEGKYTHYWLKGGRGSCKSSFASLKIVIEVLKDENAHACIFRKYGNTLRSSVYNQIVWAIEQLGVMDLFTFTVSPMAITVKRTGQQIIFKGLDDPTKSKSQKMPFGYFKLLWFEELQEFAGMREIRSVTQSYMRGGSGFTYFYTYNPPQTRSNWVNFESEKKHPNRLVHTSSYLNVPPEWLGEEFIKEAEILKINDLRAYQHEYLGIITGTGGTIFPKAMAREITDEEIKGFCNPRRGIDWGYAVDPFAYGTWEYDKTRKRIYIYEEIYKTGMLNDEAIIKVKALNPCRDIITADSAEPKSIAEFKAAGMRVVGARKGKDSVQYGIKWLQRLHEIVIDPIRCPNAWAEFSLYEFEKDKTGEFKSDYPDKNNHFIDLVRYGHERDTEKRGMF